MTEQEKDERTAEERYAAGQERARRYSARLFRGPGRPLGPVRTLADMFRRGEN